MTSLTTWNETYEAAAAASKGMKASGTNLRALQIAFEEARATVEEAYLYAFDMGWEEGLE